MPARYEFVVILILTFTCKNNKDKRGCRVIYRVLDHANCFLVKGLETSIVKNVSDSLSYHLWDGAYTDYAFLGN